MPEAVLHSLELVVRVLEIIGAGALVLGFVVATGRWFLEAARHGATPAMHRYRQALGRTVLIGLEILLAATIIKTVTLEPTLESIGLLVFMVAIRTILGWTMVLEVDGRWPWQRA